MIDAALTEVLDGLLPEQREVVLVAVLGEDAARCQRIRFREPDTVLCNRVIYGRRSDSLYCSEECRNSAKLRRRRERRNLEAAAEKATDRVRLLEVEDIVRWSGSGGPGGIAAGRLRAFMRDRYHWHLTLPGRPPDVRMIEFRDAFTDHVVAQGWDIENFGSLADEASL